MSQNQVTNFTIQVVIKPDESGFHAYCPALKGLHVGGATEEEALQNARDAAIAYLNSLVKHGEPIPLGVGSKPSSHRKHGTSRYHTEHVSLTAV